MRKSPNPIDGWVGGRVRSRRMVLGMSQEKLGDAIGLTFQQVQKYEKGTNRIGASRLHQIAAVLQVTPAYFFEGAGEPFAEAGAAPGEDAVSRVLRTSDGVALIQSFDRVPPRLRRQLVKIAEVMAEGAVDA